MINHAAPGSRRFACRRVENSGNPPSGEGGYVCPENHSVSFAKWRCTVEKSIEIAAILVTSPVFVRLVTRERSFGEQNAVFRVTPVPCELSNRNERDDSPRKTRLVSRRPRIVRRNICRD